MKKRVFLLLLLCVGWGNAFGAKPIPIERRQAPAESPTIRGVLRVAQLDEQNLCLVGYYQDFLKERFVAECGPFLKMLEEPDYQPKDWSRRFHYNFAAAEVIRAYRPMIVKAYQDKNGFTLVDSTGKKLEIRNNGYWIHPLSAGRFVDMATGEETEVRAAEVTHNAYLELAEPMKQGETYTLSNALGESVRFTFSDKARSDAIKVNQVGYATDAGRKYAYLGIWRGPELKGRDYQDWVDKRFFLKEYPSGKVVFEGKIVPRDVTPEGNAFSGEKVYDLDFSDFCQPGKYRVVVPGVGRSWTFEIGNNALGEAFYVRMRGMYQKRCGIWKEQPYTAWVSPRPEGAHECHHVTYVGNFPPNNRHYGKGKGDFGFFDKAGNKQNVNPFDLIAFACKTDQVAEGVSGGWHDAADYDRRHYHLQCTGDFVAAYLMFPENFTDDQLHLPESGNGIPDILDEAIWGLDVWRKAQNAQGGVGCWIEATSHPKNPLPETDEQPYFLALPTMESTAEYAAHAAALALALKKAGADEPFQTYLESAKKAYAFATDPSNRLVVEYKGYPLRENGQSVPTDLTYRESEKLSAIPLAKASFNLYLLTGEKKYLDAFQTFLPGNNDGFEWYVQNIWWYGTPMYLAEFVTEAKDRPEFAEIYAKICASLLRNADMRLTELNDNYQYRMPWYATNHAYVSHTSWGNFHPLNRAKPFVLAWRITGNTKYRDAALLANDWQLGANPTGSSMTSGLGKSYPVRFLDLPSYTDGIVEFVPGITPYRNTYGLARPAVEMAWGLYYSERKDHQFDGFQVPLLQVDGTPNIGDYAKFVGSCLPIWRRFANVEGWSVGASEFTVSETMSSQAAVTGCLLKPGWKPTSKILTRKPVNDFKKLPGMMALP
ncbi:MAG: glycoside hydrolase family 9 protein [Planctomycetia bacterium]|nr:glycoside hydrolase family 9 protein [Planctomycetia bacterium]